MTGEESKKEQEKFEKYQKALKMVYAEDQEKFEEYQKALKMAYADGVVSFAERNKLIALKNELGLSDRDCKNMEYAYRLISEKADSRNVVQELSDGMDKGVEQLQANGGMDGVAMEEDYEAEQNPRPDYLSEQGKPHRFDEEEETEVISDSEIERLKEQNPSDDKISELSSWYYTVDWEDPIEAAEAMHNGTDEQVDYVIMRRKLEQASVKFFERTKISKDEHLVLENFNYVIKKRKFSLLAKNKRQTEELETKLKENNIKYDISKMKGSSGTLFEIPLTEITEKSEISASKEPIEIIKAIAGEKEQSEVPDLFTLEFRDRMRPFSLPKDPFIVAKLMINEWKESKPEYLPVLNEWLKKQGCTSKESFDAFFRTINEPEHKKTQHKEISLQHER